jgi:hypothetical protein
MCLTVSMQQSANWASDLLDGSSVLTMPWLVQEVYAYLPMLRDVLAWQYCSQWTRQVGQSFVTDRFTRIVGPFIGDNIPQLCFLMHVWGAVITGSCALEMLTGQHHLTDNLNIIVLKGSFDILHKFIQETLCYWCSETATHLHDAFCLVVQTFAKYHRGGICITLSESFTEHIFDVITNSPTMGDMVFMTPGGAVAFYPEFTFNGIRILNGTLKQWPIRNFVGCMKHARYIIYNSTEFLQQPCGNACPTLWRNIVDGGPGALVLEWDSRYSVTTTMSLSHSSWRLAELCHNTACSFNSVNNA